MGFGFRTVSLPSHTGFGRPVFIFGSARSEDAGGGCDRRVGFGCFFESHDGVGVVLLRFWLRLR